MVNTLAQNQGERYGGPVKSNSTGFKNAFADKDFLKTVDYQYE